MFDDLAESPDRLPEDDGRPAWVAPAITVVSLVWFVDLLWAATRTLPYAWDRVTVDFFGGSGDADTVRELALQTLGVAAGPPAVGAVIAWLFRRPRAAALLGVAAVLGLLGGFCLYVVAT